MNTMDRLEYKALQRLLQDFADMATTMRAIGQAAEKSAASFDKMVEELEELEKTDWRNK